MGKAQINVISFVVLQCNCTMGGHHLIVYHYSFIDFINLVVLNYKTFSALFFIPTVSSSSYFPLVKFKINQDLKQRYDEDVEEVNCGSSSLEEVFKQE